MSYESTAYHSNAWSDPYVQNGKVNTDRAKSRTHRTPSQKAMLSHALQKANIAVQLDNAQDLGGARLAYAEACNLLQVVLRQTSGDDDQKKLDAIRRTYISRILELDQMGLWPRHSDKALPARPDSPEPQLSVGDSGTFVRALSPPVDGRAPNKHAKRQIPGFGDLHSVLTQQQLSRQGLSPLDTEPPLALRIGKSSRNIRLQSSFSRLHGRQSSTEDIARRATENGHLAPPPLPEIRPLSPGKSSTNFADGGSPIKQTLPSTSRTDPHDCISHLRNGNQNLGLHPIRESTGSSGSSVASVESSLSFRGHARDASGNTEIEFDTALDAAIEAAYDDGHQPKTPGGYDFEETANETVHRGHQCSIKVTPPRRSHAEVQSYSNGKLGGISRQHPYLKTGEQAGRIDQVALSENEEDLLDEVSRNDDGEGEPQSHKRTLLQAHRPDSWTKTEERLADRQTGDQEMPGTHSDSSITLRPDRDEADSALMPKPAASLTDLPIQRCSSSQSVRSRRLSGQKSKPLTIETSKLRPAQTAHEKATPKHSKSAPAYDHPAAMRFGCASPSTEHNQPASPSAVGLTQSGRPLHTAPQAAHRHPVDKEDATLWRFGSPTANRLRKNHSSSSLRSTKSRNMSLSNVDDGSDMSPITPSSSIPFGSAKIPAIPAIPTPLVAAFRDTVESSSAGGSHLLENSFHSPNTPGSPNPSSLDAPVPLEPCPNDALLRPFWLMRGLYQTLVHPRGGYLSTKLFVPRDVWKVKGVKLKNIEDKIANCDILSHALQKLATVDTCDADAVLEEMQAFESVLDQVQAALARKLGNEVGVTSSAGFFKDAASIVDGDKSSAVPRTSSVSGKSSSFSWRRLKHKNSALGLSAQSSNKSNNGDGSKEGHFVPTFPMTQRPVSRPARRDISKAQFLGPNAPYISSLARLFDAAQAIDQIARQIDDPGLRHADKTQVRDDRRRYDAGQVYQARQ